MDSHEWRVSMDWIHETAKKAVNKPVFLCGGGANEKDIIALCDKVIWLKTDEATIRSRVNIPRDHTYGTKPHELANIIKSNEAKEREYREMGATLIDARQSFDQVVNDVVGLTLK